MTKRRFIEQLPGWLRTEDLKKFFSATVDHLFQPGKAEQISGYIGQRPSYTDDAKDFYLTEPSAERLARQLEPTMVQRSSSAIERVLFYTDLLNYIRSRGGLVEDESRLFEGDFYTWAPPIDIDKINNPQNYFWFGDVANLPGAVLKAPIATYVANGGALFALPPAIAGYDHEVPMVFVDDVAVDAADITRTGDNVGLSTVPAVGQIVEVIRYGDLKTMIEGKETFDVSPIFDEVLTRQFAGMAPDHSLGDITELTTGMRIILRDGLHRDTGTTATDSYIVDGVSQSIVFIDHSRVPTTEAVYAVMDRRCRNENPWARANMWIHRSALRWTGLLFSSRAASRPVLDFQQDLELYHFGRNVTDQTSVAAIITTNPHLGDGWDISEWDPLDTISWDTTQIIDVIDINGALPGSVIADDGRTFQIGDRILIAVVVPGHPELSNIVCTISSQIATNGDTVMLLVPDTAPSEGDIVYVTGTETSMYWTGTLWQAAQSFVVGSPPLFNLYDINGVVLDDPGEYPSSNFAGSRLFGPAIGTGTADSVLGVPLKYDTYGQIIFENDISTRRYTYVFGNLTTEIKGFYFYRHYGVSQVDDKFNNDWHLAPTTSTVDPISFELPKNLTANPNNEVVEFISRNEWFDHFTTIMQSQAGFTGDVYGENNWRDSARDLSLGQRILQHRSPLLKTMLMASDVNFDLTDSIRFAEQEYSRFRGRFIQTVMDFYMNGKMSSTATYDEWTVAVLNAMKANKTVDFPYAYSGVAGGQFFVPASPAVLGLVQCVSPEIVIDNSFSAPVRLLVGHDGSRTPVFGQYIVKVSDGSSTIINLGEQPYGPVTVTLNGTPTTAFTLMGNIVSLNSAPAVGVEIAITVSDIRDVVNLALEQRIYDNIAAKFRAEANEGYDFATPQQGKFRRMPNSYTREEFVRIMTAPFLRWAHVGGFDYQSNTTFDYSDPFTFNYSRTTDVDGEKLPGHWRGIYRWYFDTDRPHLCPWEMFGFAGKPSWWESEYGSAPYARSNSKLWGDAEVGRIRQGPRAGLDARYARPNILDYLPIDDSGVLLNPMAAGIVTAKPIYQDASRAWAFGDGAPVETLWQTSPGYRFSLCLGAYLMKPARFVEHGWDTVNIAKVHGDQYIYLLTADRPQSGDYQIHGEILDDGTIVTVTGIQQWVSDYITSKGQSVAVFADAVRGMNVQLAHKMAGFTSVSTMRVVADNFGLVPEEDVSVALYSSPSIREEFYSGVVVEWTGTGWSIVGYNAVDPNFYIIPGDIAGPKAIVSISNVPEPVIVDWKPNIFYASNTLVDFEGSVYQAAKAHTSTRSFTKDLGDEFWVARPGILRASAPRVVKCLEGTEEIITVPYGTEYGSLQEVADFIFGHERYLISRGWVFDGVDSDTQEAKDWTSSVKDFLQYSQVAWEPGNVIALSPSYDALHFSTDHGTIYSLEQSFSGNYGIVDKAGMPINRRDTYVSRIDGDVVISANNAGLYGVRLDIGEIEHALIFQNTTIFNDIIYKPLFDLRQARLRLIGQRTTDWTGRLDAPGYVLIDNQIVPNFNRVTEDIRSMFDIEGAEHGVLREHARHVIGYDTRDYLENLLISDTEQFEFYQGMIQQKGAPGIFNKILRSQFVDQNRSLAFLEEWAFKTGKYGALDAQQTVSFELHQSDIRRNPQFIRFSSTPSTSDAVHIGSTDFVIAPTDSSTTFNLRSDFAPANGAFPSAGYVRLTEVSLTAMNMAVVTSYYADNLITPGSVVLAIGSSVTTAQPPIQLADRVWVYDNGLNEWEVHRVSNLTTDSTANKIVRVETDALDVSYVGAHIVLEKAHGLTSADVGKYIIVQGEARTNVEIQGIHQITAVGTGWIAINVDLETGYRWSDDGSGFGTDLPTAADPENAPVVLIMRNVRFADDAALAAATWFQPAVNELAYVDQTSSVGWKVVQWSGSAWNTARQQPHKVESSRILSSLLYENTSDITKSQLIVEPLRLNHFLVLDPIGGLISGEAERELSYLLEYDPAEYATEGWAAEHVGQLWWDLSAVRFLEAETDNDTSDATTRGQAEIEYRIGNWGKVAPNTSVNVYEWTRSLVVPSQWNGEGETYLGENTPYVEIQEYDPILDKLVPIYYFWVKGSTSVPRGASEQRRLDAAQVARLLENPTAFDIPWIAPIMADGLLISGVSQFLREDGSIVQLDIQALDFEGVVHTEWELLRNGDERSLPSPYLWDRLVDSVAGMNREKQVVPDPSLHPSARHGRLLRPPQSLFGGPQDPRTTTLAARESLVGMINKILARTNIVIERSTIEADFSEEHQISPYMLWSSEVGGAGDLPLGNYDFEVQSLAERNQLLLDPSFRTTKRRVLINRINDAIPHWSVWEYDPALDSSVDDVSRFAAADDLFLLAKSYDISVANRVERDALTPSAKQVVYVEHDEMADGFWTIWIYDPTNIDADAKGFVLSAVQDYRLGDFWDYADWFAAGYSTANPPVITYPTINDRNFIEGDAPRTTFVKIDNDGSGKWIWTAYENGVWAVVARQSGTIQFKDTLFDATKVVFVSPSSPLTDVRNRDGTFEIRALMRILRAGSFTDAELNELFFSMVNFAHAYLDQITWAFKTSFLFIAGYNERLVQSAIEVADNTENLVSYLEEVKPYRVKLREFLRVLTANTENANLHVTDFDKPLYFDVAQSKYRRLNTSVPTDLEIIQNQYPWKDWYNNFSKTGYDLAQYNANTWNPIRRFTVKLLFDRIDGVLGIPDVTTINGQPFSAAAKRINDYYNPSPTMPEKSLDVLLKLGFASHSAEDAKVADGSTIATPGTIVEIYNDTGSNYDLLVNPEIAGSPGLRLNDPHLREDRPEELVVGGHTDLVTITVKSQGTPGAPVQTQEFYNVEAEGNPTITVSYGMVVQSNDGLIIFRDGIRADPTDYVIDHFKREVTISMTHPDLTRVRRIAIRAFGFGGTTKIIEQRFYDYVEGESQDFIVSVGTGVAEVVVNGQEANATYATNFGIVTVTDDLSTGDDIVINIREGSNTAIQVHSEELAWNSAQQWTLFQPSSPAVPWAHTTTIVEVDGIRLRPPETLYLDLSHERSIEFSGTPSVSQIVIYVNGALYTGNIDTNTSSYSSVNQVLAGGPYTGQFALWNNNLICVDPLLGAQTVVIAMGQEEYTVDSSGLLTISRYVAPWSIVRATTFTNNSTMQIRTYVYNGQNTGEYALDAVPNPAYIWTNLNGLYEMPGINYDLSTTANLLDPLVTGWDTTLWDDTDEWDGVTPPVVGIRFASGQVATDCVVITVFTGTPIRLPSAFQASTIRPGKTLMIPAWASEGVPATATSTQGSRSIYTMEDGWEYFRVTEGHIANLSGDVASNVQTMTVTLRPHAQDVFSENTLLRPQPDAPGVLWVEGERIEYAGINRHGEFITLSGLYRGTKGTPVGTEQRNIAVFQVGPGDDPALVGWDITGWSLDLWDDPQSGQKVYTVPWTTGPENILVNVFTPDGISTAMQESTQYNVVVTATDISIIFVDPPIAGHYVSIIQTVDTFSHAAFVEARALIDQFEPSNNAL